MKRELPAGAEKRCFVRSSFCFSDFEKLLLTTNTPIGIKPYLTILGKDTNPGCECRARMQGADARHERRTQMPGTDAGARMQGTSVERECGMRTRTQAQDARRTRARA